MIPIRLRVLHTSILEHWKVPPLLDTQWRRPQVEMSELINTKKVDGGDVDYPGCPGS